MICLLEDQSVGLLVKKNHPPILAERLAAGSGVLHSAGDLEAPRLAESPAFFVRVAAITAAVESREGWSPFAAAVPSHTLSANSPALAEENAPPTRT